MYARLVIAYGWTVDEIEDMTFDQITMYSVIAEHEKFKAEERHAALIGTTIAAAMMGGKR